MSLIASLLNDTLNPNAQIHRPAEAKLVELQSSEDFYESLITITVNLFVLFIYISYLWIKTNVFYASFKLIYRWVLKRCPQLVYQRQSSSRLHSMAFYKGQHCLLLNSHIVSSCVMFYIICGFVLGNRCNDRRNPQVQTFLHMKEQVHYIITLDIYSS